MGLETVSVLRPAMFLDKREIAELYDAAFADLEAQALDALGDIPLAIRTLRPSDLGETNDVWAETITATANAWQDSQISSQSIPDDTVVSIFGLVDTSDSQMVTGVRIKAGQSVRAEWDLFGIISDDKRLDARTAYALGPVMITKGINVTIQYYVRQASPQAVSGVEIALIGLVAEKHGLNIQA